jgi:hypothetical protein
MALHGFKKNKKRLRLKRKVYVTKQKWKMKQEEGHQTEDYLGSLPFHHEL